MDEQVIRFYTACNLLLLNGEEVQAAVRVLDRNQDLTTFEVLHKTWVSFYVKENEDASMQEGEEEFDKYCRLGISLLVGDQPLRAVSFDLDDYHNVFRGIKAYAIIVGYTGNDPDTRAYMVGHYHEGYPETHWSRVLWTIMDDLGDREWQSVFDTFARDGGIPFEDDESATTSKVQDAG